MSFRLSYDFVCTCSDVTHECSSYSLKTPHTHSSRYYSCSRGNGWPSFSTHLSSCSTPTSAFPTRQYQRLFEFSTLLMFSRFLPSMIGFETRTTCMTRRKFFGHYQVIRKKASSSLGSTSFPSFTTSTGERRLLHTPRVTHNSSETSFALSG